MSGIIVGRDVYYLQDVTTALFAKWEPEAARILIQRRWDGVYPSFVGSNPTWDLPKRFETHQPGACCTASNGLRSRDTKRKPVRRRDTSAGEGRSEISEDRSVRRQMAVRARTQC